MKLWFLALIFLAGCGSEVNQANTAARVSVGATAFTGSAAVVKSWPANDKGLAAAPDRGWLVRYPGAAVKHGDNTWHRVEMSEAHALRAIATGTLQMTTPQGEGLDFAVEHHTEHPNGDITLMGRLRTGQAHDEVILTMGRTAAFGTVAQGAGRPALRILTRGNQTWVVETDPRVGTRIHPGMTPEGSTDILVPGAIEQVEQQVSGAAGGMQMAAAQAQSDGSAVVDLLIGYTRGYVAAMGGEETAKTRLFHLVELTNQAYTNSQIKGRVRLVGLMKVDYVDASSNELALQQLGGVAVEKNSALDELRKARDAYGADLVTLVRKFEMNDQGGCGIAWLLGAGQQPIQMGTGAYAFSVVGDGPFVDPAGHEIWCRDDAMAHEIGHNLGAHHDTATATRFDGKVEYGAYAYAFGHKTDVATGNFYTVMTYNNSDQVAYRTFSTPRTLFCGGRPCGVENQSDNARVLEQTMPIIASFRSTVVTDDALPQAPTPPSSPPAVEPPPVIPTGPFAVVCPPAQVVETGPGG